MKTINHECYVSLEVAKLLKEAGFDWECRKIYYCYHEDEDTWELEDNYKNYKSILKLDHCLLTPTLDVAQRWLIEVKDIDVYIFPTTNNKRGCVYEWGIKTFGRALWVEGQPYTNQYETYEEAQEAGIKKTLEIILEKGK